MAQKKSENGKNDGVAELEGLEIEKLELSEFLDDSRKQEGGTIAKVMAASCTTCECCCSY